MSRGGAMVSSIRNVCGFAVYMKTRGLSFRIFPPWDPVSKKCVFRILVDYQPKRCKTCVYTKERFRMDGALVSLFSPIVSSISSTASVLVGTWPQSTATGNTSWSEVWLEEAFTFMRVSGSGCLMQFRWVIFTRADYRQICNLQSVQLFSNQLSLPGGKVDVDGWVEGLVHSLGSQGAQQRQRKRRLYRDHLQRYEYYF